MRLPKIASKRNPHGTDVHYYDGQSFVGPAPGDGFASEDTALSEPPVAPAPLPSLIQQAGYAPSDIQAVSKPRPVLFLARHPGSHFCAPCLIHPPPPPSYIFQLEGVFKNYAVRMPAEGEPAVRALDKGRFVTLMDFEFHIGHERAALFFNAFDLSRQGRLTCKYVQGGCRIFNRLRRPSFFVLP